MEISESRFWGCYVAFCGQAMPVFAEEPCFLCHFHWYNFKLILMFYSSVVLYLPYQVSCRGMATELKDYESHYDRLEIHPECTKTEIRCGFGMSLSFFSIIPIITSSSIQLWQYNFVHIYNKYFSFREAWLRLSMQYHPDLNPDDEKASQRFMEIKESYTGLRKSFDRI